MIKIDRDAIEKIKTAVQLAMDTARTASGLKTRNSVASDEALEKCAMIALQVATMDMFGVHDVAIASDVTHLSNAGLVG